MDPLFVFIALVIVLSLGFMTGPCAKAFLTIKKSRGELNTSLIALTFMIVAVVIVAVSVTITFSLVWLDNVNFAPSFGEVVLACGLGSLSFFRDTAPSKAQ